MIGIKKYCLLEEIKTEYYGKVQFMLLFDLNL